MGCWYEYQTRCPFCKKDTVRTTIDFLHHQYEMLLSVADNCSNCGCLIYIFPARAKFDSKNPEFDKRFREVYCKSYDEMYEIWNKKEDD